MVVDDDDASAAALIARSPPIASSTSVPAPGVERIVAVPPWRSIRPMIDSRTPAAVGGDRVRVEAGTAVADEDLRRRSASISA